MSKPMKRKKRKLFRKGPVKVRGHFRKEDISDMRGHPKIAREFVDALMQWVRERLIYDLNEIGIKVHGEVWD